MTGSDLPSQADFDPWNGNPDARRWAHGIFGGLSVTEATQKYLERPDIYWEAFMSMGSKAFAYYFPVIEHYLYSAPDLDRNHEDWEDHNAWVLAHCVKAHFTGCNIDYVRHLSARVIELAHFIHSNIHRFERNEFVPDVDAESVAEAWAALMQTVQSCQNGQIPF